MLILGLETSCDETAAGIVVDDPLPEGRVRANAVATQLAEHQPYGGVVPEIAARAHLDRLDGLIHDALEAANVRLSDLDGIAATCGPGLIGGVMVGAMTGKAIAAARKLPFIAVNHLEAHALTARMTDSIAFPYLLLLVSGGHCQLLYVAGVGAYRALGTTLDDAVGECFDKSAKLLGLGYPGGPQIERAAQRGNPNAFPLPRPMVGRKGCDFSFAGLKTAVRTLLAQTEPSPTRVADMAASLQAAIADILEDRARNALEALRAQNMPVTSFVVGGGVAANRALCARLRCLAQAYGLPFAAPPVGLCTDNGAMVAWAGLERFRLGLSDSLETPCRPRWPLDLGFAS